VPQLVDREERSASYLFLSDRFNQNKREVEEKYKYKLRRFRMETVDKIDKDLEDAARLQPILY